MAWTLLIIAGMLEMIWPICMKQGDGFKRPLLTLFAIGVSMVSFFLLSRAMSNEQGHHGIAAGTAYVVWVGIGAVGTTLLGIMLFKESSHPYRLFFLGLVVVGIVGLKAMSAK